MLESFDFTPPVTKPSSSLIGKEAHDTSVKYLFVVVSCAYMLPFTCIGSLIIYFSAKYGPNYFIYLNIAFYMSGLPVALVQRQLDSYVDIFFGSKYTYRRRLWICLGVMTVCLVIAPFLEFYTLIADVAVVGFCTWICHGSTTSLSGMVQHSSSIMQQIGFALPAVYGVIANIAFNLAKEDISQLNLMLFYFTSALWCVMGIVAWVYLCRSDIVREKLAEKDTKLGTLLLSRALRGPAAAATLKYPLLDTANRFDEEACDNECDGEDTHGNTIVQLSVSPTFDTILADGVGPTPAPTGSVPSISTWRGSSYDMGSRIKERLTESEREIVALIDDSSFSILSQDNARIIEDSRALLKDKPKLLQYAMRSDHCRKTMEPYRWSLFITIFASILQGSFISYASGCVLDGVELPTILYFVRIFADLFGRPLALLPKPYPFGSISGVLVAAIIRGLLTTFYFSIIANIFYPHEYVRSRLCHIIVLVFQVLFSMSSGYLNCLTYEYAGKCFTDDWERVVASQYLNLTFHRACSSAVLSAISVILLVDVIKSSLNLHINTTHE